MDDTDPGILFFARTGDTNWQPLEEHLANVSTLAGNFAADIGAGEWGRWFGLLHDIGKYSREFQQRLHDPQVRVDHSTAGALEIRSQITNRSPASVTGRLYREFLAPLAEGILAGHHGGLPHVAEEFDKRLDKYRLDYSAWEKEITLPTGLPPFSYLIRDPKMLGYHLGFRARMLFSCLVDADRLDAEAFTAPDKMALRNAYPTLQDLHAACIAFMQGKTIPDAAPDSVNGIRHRVLRDALQAAEHTPGLFRLTVPTGGGKTLASLAFAMAHAIRHGLQRIIYVIPYTSIIEQTADVFREALGSFGSQAVVEHHSNYDPAIARQANPKTADDACPPAWENWDAPIIVTTSVQFFESLHASGASSARKIHNIANAVVVIDETQTLPLPLLRPCLRAVGELADHYRTSVVLCTATQPEFSVAAWMPEGIQPDTVREINADVAGSFETLRRVDVSMLGEVDNPTLVGHLRSHEKVLCIVNTRAHAREIHASLADGGEQEGVWHLSAAMHPQHRRTVIRRIKEALARPGRCVVISTQLIEAGVDLDFPVVYRSLAGLDSIAQAAGRCNREGKLALGHVYVFVALGHAPVDAADAALAQYILSLPANAGRDPLAPDVMRQYFTQRYSLRKKEGLDRKEILCHFDTCPRIDYPRIEKDFRFIDDDGQAVIVPAEVDEGGQTLVPIGSSTVWPLVEQLKDSVAAGFVPRALLRQLQPVTVSLRRREFAALTAAGAVECLGREGSFPLLVNTDLYSPTTGLVTDDPTAMRSTSLTI